MVISSKETKSTRRILTAEEALAALDGVKTEWEARNLFNNSFYGSAGEDSMALETKDAYTSGVKLNWKVMYRVLEVENKFGIHDHFCSAYCLVSLIKPKLIAMFKSQAKDATNRAEFCDYIQSCWFTLSSLMEQKVDDRGKEHGFDPDYENWNGRVGNILPYALPQARTVLMTETFKPEITKHIQETRGYKICSLDEMLAKEDSQFEAADTPLEELGDIDNTSNELYAPDFRRLSVEDYCIAKIMSENTGKNMSQVITSKEFSQVQKIQTAYTLSKMGLSDEDIEEMVEDEEATEESEKEAM